MLTHNYSKNIFNKKIAILGVLPPPYGGISVHIQRVMPIFKEQDNDVSFFSVTPWFRSIKFCYIGLASYLLYLFLWLCIKCPDRIYFHTLFLSNSLAELNLLVFFKKIFGSKLILVDHNNRFLENRAQNYKKRLNRLLQKIDQQIFMGSTKEYYMENGIQPAKNNSSESPFLPPDISQEEKLVARYPEVMVDFINKNQPLLLVNASQQTMFEGRHLYGFDLCIEVMPALLEQFPEAGFLFVTNFSAKNWRCCAKKCKVHQHCFFLEGNYQLWPLFKKVDLFVRPNKADVYPISLLEALFFKTPTVASSVCQRPDATILFDINNKKEFLEKIITILAKKYEPNKQPHYLHTQSSQRYSQGS